MRKCPAPVPQWAVDYIIKWKSILHLEEWEIQTVLVAEPDDNPDSQAAVRCKPEYLSAVIEIRSDIPQKDLTEMDRHIWHHVIIHELVHIKMARLDTFVREELLAKHPLWDILQRQYRREVEPLTEGLASILYELDQ